MAVISAEAFLIVARHAQGNSDEIGTTCLHEISRYIQDKQAPEDGLEEDKEEIRQRILNTVPPKYHNYRDVFSKAKSDRLPPLRPRVDHKIDLIPGTAPKELKFSPLYKLSLEELEAYRQYILENLDKGFIEPSATPWVAPILFVKKYRGGLRFCINYRKLNALSRKD
jgi:hypothetical protein